MLHSPAIIGFIALVAAGILLAIYSARFVPGTVSRIGVAAVSFTSIFQPAEPTPPTEGGLAVVPTTSSTPPFTETLPESTVASTTPVTPVSPVAVVPTAPVKPVTPVAPTPGPQTTTTIPMGQTPVVPTYTGLPDLITTITEKGYLTTTETSSFVASSSVPRGGRPAVQFTIKNVGTNVTSGNWIFTAAIPSQYAYVYNSPAQQVLNPGESITYTLGFDQATPGENRSISITADAMNSVAESNENNNGYSVTITIPNP